MTAQDVIELLKLEPLPLEGGYFSETYKAKGEIPQSCLGEHEGSRSFSTAIYYLITPESFSSLHRLPQDEVFHFYLGDPVQMLRIEPSGELVREILGGDLRQGQRPQVVAPGNIWQGTRLLDGGKWALLGTTVSPGFDYRDYEHGERARLIEEFPQHKESICLYTRAS